MEMIIVALNILFVFAGAKGGGDTGPLAAWGFISPATPVLHMFGVAIVYFLDPELKITHKRKELQQKIAMAEAEDEFDQIQAQMEFRSIRRKHLKQALLENANSSTTIEAINEFATDMTGQLLTEMSGKALPPPKGRDGDYGRRR